MTKPDLQDVRLRYFAAVAEAAGTAQECVAVPAESTARALRERLGAAHGEEFGRVLGISALLVNGVRIENDDVLPRADQASGIQVDVLPPFAGG